MASEAWFKSVMTPTQAYLLKGQAHLYWRALRAGQPFNLSHRDRASLSKQGRRVNGSTSKARQCSELIAIASTQKHHSTASQSSWIGFPRLGRRMPKPLIACNGGRYLDQNQHPKKAWIGSSSSS